MNGFNTAAVSTMEYRVVWHSDSHDLCIRLLYIKISLINVFKDII